MDVGLKTVGGLSENLTRAINAFRCAVVNVGDNAWNLVAAVYWTMVGVGQDATAREYLNIGYEWICTCANDADKLLEKLESSTDAKPNDDPLANACSEKASVNKANATASREEAKAKALAAKAEQERIERQKAEAKALEDALAGKTSGQLEAEQAKAFEAY